MPTFPQSASVYIAPGANPADPSTYQFTDITSDVRLASRITIQAGRQDEVSEASTTGHALTLDNRAGNYSPRNITGIWYGQLRKGTPVQTRVKLIDDTFGRTVGSGLGTDPVSGQAWTADGFWSANGTVALCAIATVNFASWATLPTVLGDDVDIFKVTSLSAVTTGSAWVDSTVVRYQDANNYVRIHTEYGLSGVIYVKITRFVGGVGTDLYNTTATSVSYSAGTKISTRVQAIGPTYRIKVWLTSGSEPAAWTASATDASTTIRGNAVGLYEWRVGGNTNAGTLTATLYEYRADVIRATTPVPEWPTRWNQPQTDSTAPIVGAGILRRLSQGQSALRSPMYRHNIGYANLLGYWPIEDGSGATQLANVDAGGLPGSLSNMSLGSTGPSGSAGAATFSNADSSSMVSGSFQSASSSAGWQFSWATKLAALPSSTTQMIAWTTSNGYTWSIILASGTYTVSVVDSSGTSLVNSAISNTGSGDPNQWITFRMKASVSAGTVSWAFAWYAQGAATVWGASSTFSGSVGALRSWTATGNASMVNGSICHVFGLTTANDDLQSYAAQRAFDGYAGETAGNRAIRLAGEESVPIIVMGDPNATALMGVQTSDTFINLLTECEAADQGLLHERGAGLGFLTWRFRINAPVSLALDFAQSHVAGTPEPVDDDQRLVNIVKLTRKNGSEVTAQNNASIALSGAYTDERTVNVYVDGQLANEAGWRLHLGTIDELRWPKISLKLHGTPSLIPAWCGIRVGSRITIANPPPQVAGSQLDLIVEGWTETIGVFTWDVDIVCSPALPWDVGVYGTSLTGSGSTTTGSTLASSTGAGQSLTLTYTNPGDRWSTTATGYKIVVNGELMTVTAMGAASGSAPTISQVATVTRAAGGYAIAHVVGESVQVFDVARYGK